MRRLLALISALMFLELFFFAVLSPLLPGLKNDLDLSTAQAGLLVAMYAFGALAAAIPATLVAIRIGVRSTAVAGLLTFSAMSVAFGFLDSFPALAISRFLQGIAGAAVWTAAMVWLLETAPAARRGELLGFAFGVSEAGAIAGPAAGGVASAIGRGALFAVIAGACALLAVAALRAPAPPRTPNEGGLPLRRMLASARVRTAMWIAFLPAVVLAAISVLGPLQQHHLGAGAGEIAATFAVAAMLGIIVRPWFGRLSDRRGPMRPIRLGLLASAPIVFLLPWVHSRWPVAALIVGALVLTGILWAPLMLMLSDACTAAGVSQIMAVAIMDLTWPPGNAIGSTGGAAIAQIAGTRWAYGAIALALLAGWAALLRTSPGSGERDLAPRPVPVGPA